VAFAVKQVNILVLSAGDSDDVQSHKVKLCEIAPASLVGLHEELVSTSILQFLTGFSKVYVNHR
jgi:hypothetical protein